jgi:serine/threonine-protein kinase RsbW
MDHCWMESFQPSTPQRVGAVRRLFLAWLDPLRLPEQFVADAAAALAEACANAVQHGSPHGELDSFHVRCDAGGQTLVLEVTDHGPGFLFLGVTRPDPLALEEHGRGIWLMAALTDSMEFHPQRGGMQVHMEKVMSVAYNSVPYFLTKQS